MAMEQHEPKVMFYNAEKGAPLPGERETISADRLSVPVEVLFNENSSAGEVVPLRSGTVRYQDAWSGEKHALSFEDGENLILGFNQLSARPGPLDRELLDQYADRLALPLGQEEPVRPEGIRATAAVLAASDTVPMMMEWDAARLERHLAYGDVISEAKPFERLTAHDVRDKAMMNTGKILCGDVGGLSVDGELLFDLANASGGSFTGDEIRRHFANGGKPLDRVPNMYKDADAFLTGEFADFMKNPPRDKQGFAEALAGQWDKLDNAMDPIQDRMAPQLALMHVACNQMGWDLLPEPSDAAAMGRAFRCRQSGIENEFTQILSDSLYEHPQPQAEKGYPDRAPSAFERMKADLEKSRARWAEQEEGPSGPSL